MATLIIAATSEAKSNQKIFEGCGLIMPSLPSGWTPSVDSGRINGICSVTYVGKTKKNMYGPYNPTIQFTRLSPEHYKVFEPKENGWVVKGVYDGEILSTIKLSDRKILLGEYMTRENCGTVREPLSCTGSSYAGLVLFNSGEKVEIYSPEGFEEKYLIKLARDIRLSNLIENKK